MKVIGEFLSRFSMPGMSEDGHKLIKTAEHHQHEKHHVISNRFLMVLVGVLMASLLISLDRVNVYQDASSGYTLGYKTGMRQVDNENGLAVFVDGDESSPQRIIAGFGVRRAATGFYEGQSKEERTATWSEFVKEGGQGASQVAREVTSVLALENFESNLSFEEMTFLETQTISTETTDEDGVIKNDTLEFSPEGIRTTFTGVSQASGEPVNYAGEHILYVLADGSLNSVIVLATADRWEAERESLLQLAGAL